MKKVVLTCIFCIVVPTLLLSQSVIVWDRTSGVNYDSTIRNVITEDVYSYISEDKTLTVYEDIKDIIGYQFYDLINSKKYDYILLLEYKDDALIIQQIDTDLSQLAYTSIKMTYMKTYACIHEIKYFLNEQVFMNEITGDYNEIIRDIEFDELDLDSQKYVIKQLAYKWYSNHNFLYEIEEYFKNDFDQSMNVLQILYTDENLDNILKYLDYILLKNENKEIPDYELNKYIEPLLKYSYDNKFTNYINYIMESNTNTYNYYIEKYYSTLKSDFSYLIEITKDHYSIKYLDYVLGYAKSNFPNDLPFFYNCIKPYAGKDFSYDEFVNSL